ncbi:MAG: GNAT family N-acetyltransferase, partial [Betaproteobacteria bacterium]|nr:GNAT family N-acetyltransferase [Betaproteobacteria bacterium]
MNIRRLAPSDADAFHALRLAALQNEPSAFGSSYEEEKDFPRITVESRLVENTDRGVFGAFEGDKLIGLVALGRESRIKLAHKAMIWGMYVSP